MALSIGIVGPPGSGKTSLFNALTRAGAGTHERKEHVGVAQIADERLHQVAAAVGSQKETAATVRVLDVPGSAAAQLGHLRQADALLAVARTPEELEELRLELLLADRDHIAGRLDRVRSQAKSGDPKLRAEVARLERLLALVDEGEPPPPDLLAAELEPLTTKPLVAVPSGIDLALEAELIELEEEEAAAFREGPAPLEQLLPALFEALTLITFFTANENEARAWTLRSGQTALEAAESIHTDIARGFIRCEVIRWRDLVECGSRAEASRRGLQRLEGKEYVVEDGDVLNIRFSPPR